jgi:hypothetical protein
VGFLDKVLEKQETKGSERYIQVLNEFRADFEAALTKIQCNDGNGFFHTGFLVKTKSGSKLHFHRCRNSWFVSDGNMFKQSTLIGPVPVTADTLDALKPVLFAIASSEE